MRLAAITALVLLLVPVSGGASASSEAAPGVRVHATTSGISVHARDVPRGEVLRALANEMAIEVRGRARVDDRITVGLENVALPEALRGVLGKQSFLVLYGPDARPSAVELLGAGAQVTLGASDAQAEGAEDAEGTPGNAPPMPGSRRQYPIGGPLAGAMGAEQASFDDLVGFAARTSDAALQRAAVERGLGILEREPELRAAMLSMVQQAPPRTLARYLIAASGEGAVAFAGTIAGAVGDPGRAKAEAVVREVRAMSPR